MSSVVSLVYFVSISPQEKYIKGFQRIISDFTTIFPGFQIRLYVDDTVPVDSPILKMAATAHFVTVIKFDFGDQAPYVKAGARFLVFQDPTVHVACRHSRYRFTSHDVGRETGDRFCEWQKQDFTI